MVKTIHSNSSAEKEQRDVVAVRDEKKYRKSLHFSFPNDFDGGYLYPCFKIE